MYDFGIFRTWKLLALRYGRLLSLPVPSVSYRLSHSAASLITKPFVYWSLTLSHSLVKIAKIHTHTQLSENSCTHKSIRMQFPSRVCALIKSWKIARHFDSFLPPLLFHSPSLIRSFSLFLPLFRRGGSFRQLPLLAKKRRKRSSSLGRRKTEQHQQQKKKRNVATTT